jgi:predicted PurR-regulated permease PerM
MGTTDTSATEPAGPAGSGRSAPVDKAPVDNPPVDNAAVDKAAAGAASGRAAGDTRGHPAAGQPEAPQAEVAGAASAGPILRLVWRAANWSWRILLVGLLVYLAFRAANTLRLLVLPLIAALLLTALLYPTAAWLRRLGFPALAATWSSILLVIAFLAGVIALAANRVTASYPTLVAEVSHTANEVKSYLAGPPFHVKNAELQQLPTRIGHYLAAHKALVAGTVLAGGRYFVEFAAGLILMIFMTFFLLKDGERIYRFLISGMSPGGRQRALNAGTAAWRTLVSYIRGTTTVAVIHAVVIGLALWLLGVPLLVPLTILVFLAAFVPLIGILVVGALAILVTLATKGWIAAVILLAVFVVENQLDSHVLQPMVVGRFVRLHPLAIIVALSVGGIVAGIPGAIVAVPTVACLHGAWPYIADDTGPGPPGDR